MLLVPLSYEGDDMPQTPHVERHFTASETVRDIVIGMSDGLTVPFALAAGLSGAVESSGIIVTAGLAEVAAGAIAMGLGGYLAARTDAEHFASERAREERGRAGGDRCVRDRQADRVIRAQSANEVLATPGVRQEKYPALTAACRVVRSPPFRCGTHGDSQSRRRKSATDACGHEGPGTH